MRNDMIDLLSDYCKKIELDITDTQLQQFDDYYRFLVEKNKVMNLTTIIEKEDVVLKHFIDSIYIMKYTDFDEKKLLILELGRISRNSSCYYESADFVCIIGFFE